MHERVAVLALAEHADDRGFGVGDRRAFQQLDQIGHQTLAQLEAHVEERTEILGVTSGVRVRDDGDCHHPVDRPRGRAAALGMDSFAREHGFADFHVSSCD